MNEAERKGANDLSTAATLAGWPTPAASESDPTTPDRPSRAATGRTTEYLGRTVGRVIGWPTTQSRDWKGVPEPGNELDHNARPLNEVAMLAGWATATVNDARGNQYSYAGGDHEKPCLKLPGMAATTSGTTPSSSPAEIPSAERSTGALRLNPHFSRWLMGYPAAWLSCVDWATPSSRKSRRNSSER